MENPYVGSASGFASAAASLANGLQSAAAQQLRLRQTQQQQMLKDQFETELRMRKEGYTPIPRDPSGLKRRGDLDQDRIISDPFGRSWVAPDAKAKGDATPQQSFTDLRDLLEKGGVPSEGGQMYAPGGPAAEQQAQASLIAAHQPVPDPSRVITVPGSGKQVYMPTQEEQATLKGKLDAANITPHLDTEHFNVPVAINPRTQDVKPLNLPQGVEHNAKPDAAEKWSYSRETNNEGQVTLLRSGEQGAQMWGGKAWIPLPGGARVGPKRRDPDSPTYSSSAQDVADTAQAIKDGQAAPVLSNYSFRDRTAIAAQLKRGGYNQALAEQDWKATQRHLSTLNGTQQERLRQAITFTYDSTDNIERLYDEWKKYGTPSGVKIFNRLALGAAKQLPGRAGEVATALEAQINDLTSELGTVYKGGNSSTDESLKLASANLKADWNEQTFKRALQQIRTNLQIRRNSIMSSEAVGVRPGSPYTPQTPAEPPARGSVKGPAPGAVEQGYRFKGGDPSRPENWEKVK